jgi:hypothetical protein
MANYAETCSVYIYNKEKKSEHQPKLHVDEKAILKSKYQWILRRGIIVWRPVELATVSNQTNQNSSMPFDVAVGANISVALCQPSGLSGSPFTLSTLSTTYLAWNIAYFMDWMHLVFYEWNNGLQPGVSATLGVREDILLGTRKHPAGYVKSENISI